MISTDKAITKQNALSIRKQIKEITSKKFETDLDFCEKIYYSKYLQIISGHKEIPFYQFCGFDSWRQYIEQEVQITMPKAKRMIEIYNKYFIELDGVFNPKTDTIDIYKLQLLVPIINAKNCKSIINKARISSKEALKELLQPKNIKSLHKSITYQIVKKELVVVEKAMNLARKEFGDSLNNGQIFTAILSKYIETQQQRKLKSA